MSRISDLPRRDWQTAYPDAVEVLTAHLRTPNGTMSLLPIQAVSLVEAVDCGGLFAYATAGTGKTLLSALLPTVFHWCQRPLLLVRASLIEKTHREIEALSVHWRIRDDLEVRSYSALSAKTTGPTFLEDGGYDLIIPDEAHRFRSPTSSRTKRMARYMEAHPYTIFCPLSGTFQKESCADFAHLAYWALGARSPLPTSPHEVRYLADCTGHNRDHTPEPPYTGLVQDYGPLAATEPRKALRERLASAPGMIISTDTFTDVELEFVPVFVPPAPEVEASLERARKFWEAPDGWPYDDARQMWALIRQLSLGFYYYHDPRPPEDWLEARRDWCRSVRRVLEWGDARFDSPGQVEDAVRSGELALADWGPWSELRDTFVPKTSEAWLSDAMLDLVAQRVGDRPTLVWVEHIEFGRRLSELTGWGYYRQQALEERTKEHIMDAPTDRPAILSLDSCGEGLHLVGWNRNLFVTPPTSHSQFEQAVSRTHRQQQERDVLVEYLVTCQESLGAVATAVQRSRAEFEETGREQKLLWAGLTSPPVPSKLRRSWAFRDE